MSPPIIIIAAMSKDRVIGLNNGMPWHVPAEYAQFLRQVEGQTLIMGRRSFEIFGPDLTRCHLIVVSRTLTPRRGIEQAVSLPEALRLARQHGRTTFVGGGASIYEQALPLANRMHLSEVHGDYPGDTYFPEFERAEWSVVAHEMHPQYDYSEYVRRIP